MHAVMLLESYLLALRASIALEVECCERPNKIGLANSYVTLLTIVVDHERVDNWIQAVK